MTKVHKPSTSDESGEFMIGPQGQCVFLPEGDDDTVIDGEVVGRLLNLAGIDHDEWDKLA
jgi:hypothetical protein